MSSIYERIKQVPNTAICDILILGETLVARVEMRLSINLWFTANLFTLLEFHRGIQISASRLRSWACLKYSKEVRISILQVFF